MRASIRPNISLNRPVGSPVWGLSRFSNPPGRECSCQYELDQVPLYSRQSHEHFLGPIQDGPGLLNLAVLELASAAPAAGPHNPFSLWSVLHSALRFSEAFRRHLSKAECVDRACG